MKLISLLLLACALSSCRYFKSPAKINADDFKIAHKKEILCFDLTNDAEIKGVILVKSERGIVNHTIALPFKANDVENADDIMSTNANYGTVSVFNFKGSASGETAYSAIKFIPQANDWPNDLQNVNEFEDGIYLNQSGLERHFVYKYSKLSDMATKFANADLDTIQAVAVKMPDKVKGLALSNGSMYAPMPKSINGTVRIFGADHLHLAKVEISYLLPANPKQMAAFEIMLKLLAVITVPLIDLIFLKRNRRLGDKTKKYIKYGAIIFEGIIIGVMVLLIMNESIQGEKISDFVIFIVGSIFTIIVSFYKDGETPSSTSP